MYIQQQHIWPSFDGNTCIHASLSLYLLPMNDPKGWDDSKVMQIGVQSGLQGSLHVANKRYKELVFGKCQCTKQCKISKSHTTK